MSIQKWIVFDKQTMLFDCLSAPPSCFFSTEVIAPFLTENTFVFSFEAEAETTISCFLYENGTNLNSSPFTWLTLRDAFEHLDTAMVSHIIKVYGFLKWHHSHRFCSQCGSALILQENAFEKYCSHCNNFSYPVLSPSVIVRIRRNNEILLARTPRLKQGIYGLIAGFVEIGETLEEAVHREVKEETSLSICNLNYFGSQFWPFPHSFMVGFTADYAGGELIINYDELEDAAWFDRSKLPTLPTSKSIAYQLIDDFRQGAKE